MKKVLCFVIIGILSFSLASVANDKWKQLKQTAYATFFVDTSSIETPGCTVKYKELGIYNYPYSLSEKKYIDLKNKKASANKNKQAPPPKTPVTAEAMPGLMKQAALTGEYMAKKQMYMKEEAKVWQKPFRIYQAEKIVNCKYKDVGTYAVTTYDTNKNVVSEAKYAVKGSIPAPKEPISSDSIATWVMSNYCKEQ